MGSKEPKTPLGLGSALKLFFVSSCRIAQFFDFLLPGIRVRFLNNWYIPVLASQLCL